MKKLAFFAALMMVLSICFCAEAVENVDLSKNTYSELNTFMIELKDVYSTYHTPSDAQKNAVLLAVKTETEAYCTNNNIRLTGWAWYDDEYTYTKDWDFYTLRTHMDYKNENGSSKHAKIYAEVYGDGDNYIVSYLTADDIIIKDIKAEYNGTLQLSEPAERINASTGLNLAVLTRDELDALYNQAQSEIAANHSVPENVSSLILLLSKSELEQYFLDNGMTVNSYAWYDNEFIYIRDRDYYRMETHVDYKNGNSSSVLSGKLYSEVCCIDGRFELVYLSLGEIEIKNIKQNIAETKVDGIPKYSWVENGKTNMGETTVAVTPEPQPELTPEIVYVTPEPQPELTPEVVYVTPESQPELTPEIVYVTPEPNSGLFSIGLSDMTDDQLAEAAESIKGEQKARIKTKIVLSVNDVMLAKGKSQKITAEIVDLPEGEKAPKFVWNTSDKKIVTCSNGMIKGVSVGSALITCSCTLADGTEISGECKVQVIVPANSLTAQNYYWLEIGTSEQIAYKIKPDNATMQTLSFTSSDEQVVTVDASGMLTAVGEGEAEVLVSTTDGSNKSVTVKVYVYDNRISLETAKKVVLTGIGNYSAEDVYTADGMHYDKAKFHPYGYYSMNFKVVDEGTWTTDDDGLHWHVEGLLLQHKTYNGYFRYRFDVRRDELEFYYMENGWMESAKQLKWLEAKDPSKYDENDLSNLEYNTCFVVDPLLF